MPYAEFLKYLAENNRKFISGEAKSHAHLKRLIIQNPREVGINETISSTYTEIPILGEDGRHITIIDIVFAATADFYFIEAKSNIKQTYAANTKGKLRMAHENVKSNFNIDPYLIVAYMNGNRIKTKNPETNLEYLL